MALNENRLSNKIKALQDQCRSFEAENSENDARDYFANQLAKAIVEEIKEAQIIYQTGLTAPNGPVAGTFKGTLT